MIRTFKIVLNSALSLAVVYLRILVGGNQMLLMKVYQGNPELGKSLSQYMHRPERIVQLLALLCFLMSVFLYLEKSASKWLLIVNLIFGVIAGLTIFVIF